MRATGVSRRGAVPALALLADMLMQRPPVQAPDRWSRASIAVSGLTLASLAQRLPGSLGLWSEAAILGSILGMHRMRADALELARRLDSEDLEEARRVAGRLMASGAVSSALATWDQEALSAGAVEAIHRAMADDVIAPLYYYTLLGLPGAMLYELLASGTVVLGTRGDDLLERMRANPRRLAGRLRAAMQIDCRMGRPWLCCWRKAPEATQELPAPDASILSGTAVRRAARTMRAGVTLGAALALVLSRLARGGHGPMAHFLRKG